MALQSLDLSLGAGEAYGYLGANGGRKSAPRTFPGWGTAVGAASALARRSFGDGRTRNRSFALFLALIARVQAVGYERSYRPSPSASGSPRASATTRRSCSTAFPTTSSASAGYAIWWVGGTLAMFAAAATAIWRFERRDVTGA